MNQDQKKLVKAGLILLILFVIETIVFYRMTPRKVKTPHTPLKVIQKQVTHPKPSTTPSPSASPSTLISPDPFAGLAANGTLESPNPSLSPQPLEEGEDDPDLDFLISFIFHLLGTLPFFLALFFGYRWLLRRKASSQEATENSSSDSESSAEPTRLSSTQGAPSKTKTDPKALPTTVYVRKESKPVNQVDAILIDEDPQVLATWLTAAQAKGKNLLTFHSVAEFMKSAPELSTQTDIFLAMKLGSGILGGSRSKRIFDAGFKRIFLTNSEPMTQSIPSWVSMIVSKSPPWA